MRLFFAVKPGSSINSQLADLQSSLREHRTRGKYTDLENLHITLHFIGEAEPEQIPEFRAILEKASLIFSVFSVRLSSFGSFRQGKQDLIYAKVKSSRDSLTEISEFIRKNCSVGDFKPMKPHITLVRRGEISYRTLKILKKTRFDLPSEEITSLYLMESRKIDGKLRYLPVAEIPLKA